MKSILFIALFLLFSCEDNLNSEQTVALYKCLLLDSDTVYNHLNSLVEAVTTMDPVKLYDNFSTILPALINEYNRCKSQVTKTVDDDIILKSPETEIRTNTTAEFFKALLKVVTTYFMPFLNNLGINLKKICNEAFPHTFICDLLE